MKKSIFIVLAGVVGIALMLLLRTKSPASIAPLVTFDATKPHSIADWTNAIPELKLSLHSKWHDSWTADEKDATKYRTFLLAGKDGDSFQYTADFIDIGVENDGIQRIDLHSPKMSIDDLHQFGNQLLQLMGKDKTKFNTWCDKVGNRWMDQPEYSSGNAQVPNSDKTYSFSAHPTFDDNKPWYIYFVIAGK